MRLSAVFLVLVYFIANAVGQTDTDWEEYKKKFSKNFVSSQHEVDRKQAWRAHYRSIVGHNAIADKGLSTFRQAPNHLTDHTDEEYKVLLGAKFSTASFQWKMRSLRQVATTTLKTTTKPTTTTKTTTKPTTTTRTITTTRTTTRSTTTTKPTITIPYGLPPSVDYRNSSCTAAVKSQGSCGSCWAFSATYETEYYNCMKNGALTLLSEQNLVDCDPYSYGCNGGCYDCAWYYTIKAGGQCPASTYAYKATTQTCKQSSCTPAATLTSFTYLDNNVTAITEVVAKIGPVSVAIDASRSSFRNYASGVYADPACTTNTNHAINVVGYGTAPDGTPYWIVRNSWSTRWGMKGYGYIKRGVNMCGIEDWVAYPVA